MNYIKRYFLGVVVFSATLFSSCDFSKNRKSATKVIEGAPIGISHNIRMVYTDSTKVVAVLTAPVHYDYTNLELKYSEFPEGVKVSFYDKGLENQILAKYGIIYNQTSLVDLKGNVTLISSDGSTLKTEQLYWDVENDWIFTEEKFNFVGKEYDVLGKRLDSNKDFSVFKTGELTGTLTVKQQ